jgi:Urea transporter
MEKILAKWKSLCASSRVLRFLDINLRGIGQVMFQDNPLTGALFLIAIGWGSYAAGVPQVAIAGVVAVIVATFTAQWLRVDVESLNAGLYGFNGILVGLALATFLAPGPLLWVYVILGAAVSVVVMLATTNVVKPWGGALTFPFVLTTWILLLATYGLTHDMGRFPAGNRGDSYPRTCGNGRGRKCVHGTIRCAGSRDCDRPKRAARLRARLWYRRQAYRREGDAHPSLSNCKRQQADYFRSNSFVAGAGQADARRQGVRFGWDSGSRLPHPFHEICQ